jgi:hypothetical protein
MYNVYHIIIAEGNYASTVGADTLKQSWTSLMGQRAIVLKDHTKLAELIISLIQVNEGVVKDEVIDSWDGSTSLVIKAALDDVVIGTNQETESGIVTL